MYNQEKTQKALARVQEVIEALLHPETGCPWDKEQTPESLTKYITEECFECIDAIRHNEPEHIADEMGDLLFLLNHVAHFYSQEKKGFDLADAFNCSADKMIRRHPHVFANAKFNTQEEHMQSWEAIKKKEKLQQAEKIGVYRSLVRELPPLTKAYRIHSKAAQAKFTWEKDEEVEQQVEAEWLELYDALQDNNKEAIEHELGDMIFSLVELGRRKGIDAATATDKATNRFLHRFENMEKLARERGLKFEELSLDEKDELWNEVKNEKK